MKKCLLLIGWFMLICVSTYAQKQVVTGTVITPEDGSGMPGVTVLIKGTNTGTTTNNEGKFKLSCASSDVLVFTFVGMTPQEVAVGSQTDFTIKFKTEIMQLNEVVVTALGIERDKKALGYALQAIKGSEITQARETNLVNAMSGKIAGVQVTSSNGTPGASSRILIRGVNSIGGNNQPLFVVDGVPIDNTTFNSTSPSASSPNVTTDYGNGASSINPDDIENISVLKGANAAALYGSRAANGVILITTKSGKNTKGLGITVNSNISFENPFRIPDYQNEYGQGAGGKFEYKDGKGGGVNDGVDESWGPKLDGRLLPQYNSPIDANGVRTGTPWIARPDNVKNFYNTGVSKTNSISLSGANEKGDFRLGFTDLNQTGMLPGVDYIRQTLALNLGYKLSDKLSVKTSVNYIKDGSKNRQNLLLYFTWFGRQVDLADLQNYLEPDQDPTGWPVQRNWNLNYWNNPYFALNNFQYGNAKDRIIGNVAFTYKFTDELSFTGRTGMDYYIDRRTTKRSRSTQSGFPNGLYWEDNYFLKEQNTDFLITYNKKINNNFNLTLNGGGNQRSNTAQRDYLEAPELTIPNLYTLANTKVRPVVGNANYKKEVNSLYGSTQISWKDQLFLDATARNDWSSTLPKLNNSYFYPSISLSGVITDIFDISSRVLPYAKLRASWAKVGSDTDPYRLSQVYSASTAWGAQTTFAENNTIFNDALKPEITTALEFGLEARLWNRINVELTYYDKNSKNQILKIGVPQSTGYLNKFVNAGEISNKGIEVQLSATPFKTESGFRWDIGVNFAKNVSKVVELDGVLQTYQINDFGLLRNVILEARVGDPYGNFYGTYYVSDPQGNIVFSGGKAVVSTDRKVLGNVLPKWTGGFMNSFSFKGLTLSTLIDVKSGGSIYAHSVGIGRYTGVLAETAIGRETGIVGVGVKNIGTSDNPNYVPNDVSLTSEDYHHTFYARTNNEAYLFDGSYVKLREAKISFAIPNKWFGKTPFRNASISVVGRNLLLIHSNVPHIDPETSYYADGNVQGFESGQTPSARSYGFNLTFGL
jgi:TonB-linked SusC/RagA family outer membrane protein